MNHAIAFADSRIVIPGTTLRDAVLSIADGKIASIDQGEADGGSEWNDLLILPGFVDVHIHGAVGIDVNTADAGGLIRIAEFLGREGVTAWVPTLVPDSDEAYRRAIAAIDELMSMQTGRPIAQAVGVHYEGVFANEKMCGALRPEYFKRFSGSEIDELPRLKSGVHMITLAPEVEGGIELISELRKRDWVVSIGHTNAGPEVLDRAFDAGARHMTHFFNAMTGLHHRDVGAVGWGLCNSNVTFDIIADGVHVHPKILGMACKAKSIDSVVIISDSIAPTGLGDGEFEVWGEKIKVSDGRTQNERGSIAGSVASLRDGALLLRTLGLSDADVVKMTSSNPAKLLGLDGGRGSIEVGKLADIVALDRDGNVEFTMIGGQMVNKE